jgi:hypothetical protein
MSPTVWVTETPWRSRMAACIARVRASGAPASRQVCGLGRPTVTGAAARALFRPEPDPTLLNTTFDAYSDPRSAKSVIGESGDFKFWNLSNEKPRRLSVPRGTANAKTQWCPSGFAPTQSNQRTVRMSKRTHVVRPLGSDPFPVVPPEPLPDPTLSPSLETPAVSRPAETDGAADRFALPDNRPA